MSDGKLLLSILTPERKLVERAVVREVFLTGSEGTIEVLPGHTAMMGTLEAGRFAYVSDQGAVNQDGFISHGFFEVAPTPEGTEVSVLAETLELQDEIDIDRARKAQKAAEQALSDANLDEHRFRKYQTKLQRSLGRQQFGGKL